MSQAPGTALSNVEEENGSNKDKNYKDLTKHVRHRIETFEKNVGAFPTSNNHILDSKVIENLTNTTLDDYKSVYPLCHGAVLLFSHKFIKLKRQYGSLCEKKLYNNKFNIVDLFDRIAQKRAVCFLNCDDSFMLRNGITGSGGWHNVGCDDDVNNKKYATLGIDSYMTYDEIMISAMCGISSQTQFINDGARKNCGKAQDKNTFINKGVYMGLIGARFEKPGYMEHLLMTVNSTYTTQGNGFGIIDTSQEKAKEKAQAKVQAIANVDEKSNYNGKDRNNIVANNKDNENIDNKTNNSDSNKTEAKNDNDSENEVKQKETAVVEDLQLLTQSREKLISLFCELYGNIEYIPTYNELNQLFDKAEKLAIQDNSNTDNDDLSLLDYLYLRYEREESNWGDTIYFDIFMYKVRMRISLELFLFDSDWRTHCININNKKNDKNNKILGYCHLVGLGLGVWTLYRFEESQTRIFVQCVKDIIESTNLPNIGVIDFSWFSKFAQYNNDKYRTRIFNYDEELKCYYCFDASKKHKIDIIFSNRNPAQLLDNKYCNYNLCAMYAWDGNALPGNEYYMGCLSASGDPAAASCSTIPFIQNSQINKEYINANNTCIYFRDEKNLKNYKRIMLGDLYQNVQFEQWEQWAISSYPYPNYFKQCQVDLKKLLTNSHRK